LDIGRDWTYFTNGIGGVFVGYSMELGSALKFVGISGFESLPRLTMFWGEPGIAALFAVLLVSIDLRYQKRWRASVQLPLVAAILATQSFGGLVVYLVVTLSVLAIRNQQAMIASRSMLGKLSIVALAIVVIQLLFVQSQSKFGSSSISLTDRAGESGILGSFSQMLSSPLGVGVSGGINLIQAGVNSGLPTLLIGLFLYLFIPLVAMQKYQFSPLFLVPMLAAIFIQPPFLPLWLALLGLFWGDLLYTNELRKSQQLKSAYIR
jgi:hypothetical protein